MNYRRNEDKIGQDLEHTDNIILDVKVLSEDALLSAAGLRSEYYTGVSGESEIQDDDLIGATIFGVWSGNQDYASTDGVPAPNSAYYHHDSEEGTIEFGFPFGSTQIIHVVFVAAAGLTALTEPVTLQQAKDYLRLEGFIDDGESPASTLSDFDYDDTLITDMITTARRFIEQKDNISLVPKTLSVILTNGAGMIGLPYSPIGTVTSITDEEGVLVSADSYKIIGANRKFIREPFCDWRTVLYSTLAEGSAAARIEIKRIVADLYDNRKVEGYYKKYVFTRKSWIV